MNGLNKDALAAAVAAAETTIDVDTDEVDGFGENGPSARAYVTNIEATVEAAITTYLQHVFQQASAYVRVGP